MSPGETGSALVRRLLAELQADSRALLARWDEIKRYSSHSSPSEEGIAALALAMDRSYSALESLLERISRALEGGPPTGQDWHRILLQNAKLEINQVRPAVLAQDSMKTADELRRFRQFLRQAYASPLDGLRVLELGRKWLSVRSSIEMDLNRFEQFLEQLASRLAES